MLSYMNKFTLFTDVHVDKLSDIFVLFVTCHVSVLLSVRSSTCSSLSSWTTLNTWQETGLCSVLTTWTSLSEFGRTTIRRRRKTHSSLTLGYFFPHYVSLNLFCVLPCLSQWSYKAHRCCHHAAQDSATSWFWKTVSSSCGLQGKSTQIHSRTLDAWNTRR